MPILHPWNFIAIKHLINSAQFDMATHEGFISIQFYSILFNSALQSQSLPMNSTFTVVQLSSVLMFIFTLATFPPFNVDVVCLHPTTQILFPTPPPLYRKLYSFSIQICAMMGQIFHLQLP